MFSDFHDYGDTRVYTPNAGNTIKSVDGTEITFDNALDCQAVNQAADNPALGGTPGSNPCSPGSYAYRHYVRRPDQQVYSFLAGARHDIGASLITYEFAGSRSHNIGGQDFETTNFGGSTASYDAAGNLVAGATGADLALNLANPRRPKLMAQDGSNIYDPTQYLSTDSSYTRYIATQLNFQGAASYARRYNAHSHLGTLEMGIKIRNSRSTQNENDQLNVLNSGGAPFALSSVLGTYTNPNYYDHSYQVGTLAYGPTSNYNAITAAVQSALTNNNFVVDQVGSITKSAGAFFDANERIYPGMCKT